MSHMSEISEYEYYTYFEDHIFSFKMTPIFLAKL